MRRYRENQASWDWPLVRPGSPLLADVIREMGFRKADDFYVALGQAKISARVVTNKLLQRLKQGEAVSEERPGEDLVDFV